MVYGKEGVFDADRLIDLLRALEAFRLTEPWDESEAKTGGGGGGGMFFFFNQEGVLVRRIGGSVF